MAQGDDKTGQNGTNFVLLWHGMKLMQQSCWDTHGLTRGLWWIIDPKRGIQIKYALQLAVISSRIKATHPPKWQTSLRQNSCGTACWATEGAKYMCLDLKNFYLTAALDYF
jgi:hypothetical protein